MWQRSRSGTSSGPDETSLDCPYGQLTRPWKWLTRHNLVAHWNERISTFTSVSAKPE
jgi:hypothetical protein